MWRSSLPVQKQHTEASNLSHTGTMEKEEMLETKKEKRGKSPPKQNLYQSRVIIIIHPRMGQEKNNRIVVYPRMRPWRRWREISHGRRSEKRKQKREREENQASSDMMLTQTGD